MDTAELVEGLLRGEARALARLLTLLEDGSEDRVREIVHRIHPKTGSAQLIGVTGSPGVGKSTLVNRLVREWRRGDRRVAVLAVDPTSPFSGGALLGDRVRMQDHALDPGVFIRSMASRGSLGGLSWATPQGLLALDAAGFDVVVVETVGVGQAEVEVASVADTTIVTLAPGMGDSVQAAKAGILEVADVLCVNKADHEGADRAVSELREMQRLGGDHDGQPQAPIVRTVAHTGEGLGDLANAIDDHRRSLLDTGGLEERRLQRARLQVREIALGSIRRRFKVAGNAALAEDLVRRVAARDIDPYEAADELLAKVKPGGLS